MRCRSVQKEFTAFIDGELSPRQTARVQAHLGVCTDCPAEMGRIKRVVDIERDALLSPVPELSLGFETRLRQRLVEVESEGAPSWWYARWWKPLLVSGVALIAVLIAAAPLGGPSAVLVPLGIQAPPAKVAKEPDLFKDYEIIERLDELEHFDTVDTVPLEEDMTGRSKGAA